MVKKVVVIGLFWVVIGMSTFPCIGTMSESIVPDPVQKTRFSPWESIRGFQVPMESSGRFVSPGINFPLPGEVFRVGDVVEINGTTAVLDFESYLIEWGVGMSPTEWFTEGVTLVENGTGALINMTLGFWDTGMITDAAYYTILLTINLVDTEQLFVNVSIYLDPTLHQNFPFGWPEEILGAQVAIWSPIALSDINLDGYPEIGFGTVTIGSEGGNNNDFVIDHNANVLNGWPIQIISIQGSSLTFANIETTTSSEEVIGGMWGNKIYVWYTDGTIVPGWPKSIAASRSSAAVVDLDGDDDLEVIVPSTDGGGKIYAVHHNGTMVTGWPVTIGSPLRAPVATADLDSNGFPEIVCGDQNGYVHVYHGNGTVVEGWPVLAHDFIKSSPVIADLEDDGDLEVIICSGFTQLQIVSAYHHNGSLVDGWPVENGLAFAQPSVADLDGDGDLEILCGGAITGTPTGKFYVWHHNGTIFDGWPLTFPWDGSQILDYIYGQPVVGDIDGDADMEIIVGSYHKKLYAWHEDATTVTGWPKIIGDAVDSTAALADMDLDGLVEVTVAGDDGKIYVWDMSAAYNASNIEWPQFQYDNHHTGCYHFLESTNRPPVAPTITGPAKGTIKVATGYEFTTTDPNDDEVYYFIDWGDASNSSWIGPYSSGDTIAQSHTWSKKGNYEIKAKAKDSHGLVSDWGTLAITMPFSSEYPIQVFWERLVERFFSFFPLLKILLQR